VKKDVVERDVGKEKKGGNEHRVDEGKKKRKKERKYPKCVRA
jgi:hypothetical protein